MLVAIGHSALNHRLCPLYQFISRQAPRPIVPRPSALENRSTMRSSNSARNSSAPKRSKLLPLRISSKQLLHGVSWSRRPATARSTISTPYLSVLLFLRMILACHWWPLLAATRTPTRARSSAFTLPVAAEPSSALESHAPWWWRPWLHRPRRRHSTVAASLPEIAAPIAASLASHSAPQVAASCYWAQTSQAPPAATQLTPPSHLAEVLGGNCPSSSSGSTGSKGGPACRLVDLPTTSMKIWIRRSVIKTLITSVKANF